MKKELNPAVVGFIIVIAIAAVAFFLWKGTGGGGNKKPGEVGNPSPFSPGGYATGKGGAKPGGTGGTGAPVSAPSGGAAGR